MHLFLTVCLIVSAFFIVIGVVITAIVHGDARAKQLIRDRPNVDFKSFRQNHPIVALSGMVMLPLGVALLIVSVTLLSCLVGQ